VAGRPPGFDLQILWNKPGRQATVFAEITEATLQALPGILDPGRDGYDDTTDPDLREPGSVGHLFESPIMSVTVHNKFEHVLSERIVRFSLGWGPVSEGPGAEEAGTGHG
jgi:hypothetical protein